MKLFLLLWINKKKIQINFQNEHKKFMDLLININMDAKHFNEI